MVPLPQPTVRDDVALCGISRGNGLPTLVLFEEKHASAPPGWQDGCRGVLINNMPRTIEKSHYRGNTRANVNLFFGGS